MNGVGMMSELLPCPFCGEMPSLHAAQVIIDGDCPESIDCENDFCDEQPSTGYMSIKDAVKRWNERRCPA